MKILEIRQLMTAGGPAQHACIKVTELGLRGRDDIVTVIDQATWSFCRGEGREGLCTAKFNADLIVDELIRPQTGSIINAGSCDFLQTGRHKHCYPGCSLDPSSCLLNDMVLFLKVMTPGEICIGDELNIQLK